MENYIEDKEFNKLTFTENPLEKGEYEYCTFSNCDLAGASFGNSILQGVDFKTSYNFAIDPEINRIKGAKFSTENALGLLAKYDIKIEPSIE